MRFQKRILTHTQKLVITKEKCTNLDEVEAKHIIKYEIVFQWLKVAKLGIHKIQIHLERMEKGWGLFLYPVPTKNNLEIPEDTIYNLNIYPICRF
jgi:hypothetical protein